MYGHLKVVLVLISTVVEKKRIKSLLKNLHDGSGELLCVVCWCGDGGGGDDDNRGHSGLQCAVGRTAVTHTSRTK